MPVGSGGSGGTGSDQKTQNINRQIEGHVKALNAYHKAYGIASPDMITMMGAGMPASKRKEFYENQLKTAMEKLPTNKQIEYRRRLKAVENLSAQIGGGLPQIIGTVEDAERYLEEAEGDMEKAKQLAAADGVILE